MFRKILIANRGEIAVRVLRACRVMGIPAAVIYSDADRQALHVRMADEAIYVGPSAPTESYLSIPKVIQAAMQCGADAVHPGYGFLSENAAFAQAVHDVGITFIGPPPAAIALMGDKGQARRKVEESDVPVVPGYDGPDSDDDLERHAKRVGYPILVKAAAGGGGKGMHVVDEPGNLKEALAAARREAQHAFGDSRLILERYIPRARHIEFQILADQHGKILHLFERECSIQRRHQKIIEETPSPFITEDLRSKMGQAAIAAGFAAGYQNAGTIEFIVDPHTNEFFFLEMNTRLQVEHPVTELVTGLDIVQWQIRIAAGEHLLIDQKDISQRGHAIECRLYAEDPANNFLPSTGKILQFIPPEGPGIRVDSGYSSGDEISIHYDPLVAKLISYAENRSSSLRRMSTALKETVLLGTTHNGQFLQDLVANGNFVSGDFYTTWVEEFFGDWQPPECILPPEAAIAAGFMRLPSGGDSISDQGKDRYNPWMDGSGYRPGVSSITGEKDLSGSRG